MKKQMKFRLTIGMRLGVTIAVTALLGLTALIFGVTTAYLDLKVAERREQSEFYTKLIASEAAASINVRQKPAIERRLTNFREAFARDLATLDTYDPQFNKLTTFASESLAQISLDEFVSESRGRLENGEVVIEVRGDTIVAAAQSKLASASITGYVATAWSLASMTKDKQSVMRIASTYLCITLVVLVIVQVLVVTYYFSRPLLRLTKSMARLAEGDLVTEIAGVSRTDELGDASRTLQIFRENAMRMEEMRAEQLRKDVEAQELAQAARRELIAKMADEFENSVLQVVQTFASNARQIGEGAGTLAETATVTGAETAKLSKAASEVTASVDMVSSATAELASSVSEVGIQSTLTSDRAKVSMRIVDEANDSVRELTSNAESIGSVIKTISEIAQQTNLLALNATIEAARAGEAGRGFTVVAQEVKNLAAMTTTATETINDQIRAVQGSARTMVQALGEIRESVRSMQAVSTAVAGAVEEQTASTSAISQNIGDASSRVAEIARGLTRSADMTDNTRSASQHLLNAAQSLVVQTDNLGATVDNFLMNIRRA